MRVKDIPEFYARLQALDPEPKGELNYVNSYTLLVAVVLSAQATDVGVNKATGPLFEIVDTPEKMVTLGEAKLKDFIKTIGLFNSKAKNVIALSNILVEQYDSTVPEDRETLETLPGVGRKTANVVLNIAFGHPTIAVDTHLFRIGNRTLQNAFQKSSAAIRDVRQGFQTLFRCQPANQVRKRPNLRRRNPRVTM